MDELLSRAKNILSWDAAAATLPPDWCALEKN